MKNLTFTGFLYTLALTAIGTTIASTVVSAGYIPKVTLKKGSQTIVVAEGTPSGKAYSNRNNVGYVLCVKSSVSACVSHYKSKGYN